MKAHKYWSLGALAAMIGTFYTGYKNMKTAHKYFACSSLASSANLPHSGKAWFCCETSTVMELVFLPFIYSWWTSTC